ncbi:MAG: hypothetical protein LC721_04100 [Actinobacteria bacterium]|nr:hypothetical protein [Actinomycetota bacterium]
MRISGPLYDAYGKCALCGAVDRHRLSCPVIRLALIVAMMSIVLAIGLGAVLYAFGVVAGVDYRLGAVLFVAVAAVALTLFVAQRSSRGG